MRCVFAVFSGAFQKIVCFVGFYTLFSSAHRRFLFSFFGFSLGLLNMYFRFARLDSIQDKEENGKRNTSAADIYIVACIIAHGVHRK